MHLKLFVVADIFEAVAAGDFAAVAVVVAFSPTIMPAMHIPIIDSMCIKLRE